MIVYRLELRGIGPFTQRTPWARNYGKNTRTRKVYRARLTERHKMIQGSTVGAWDKAHGNKKYLFGCPDKEMLKIYFGGSLKPYFELGYRIKRYKVPDDKVVHMGTEVAFPVSYHKFGSKKRVRKEISKRSLA